MAGDKFVAPPEPVWWESWDEVHQVPIFTKTQTYFSARQALGGDPRRVIDEGLLDELELAEIQHSVKEAQP